MAKRQARWILSPPRPPASLAPSESEKIQALQKANEFIEATLNPMYIKPDQKGNDSEIVSIFPKWYRNYLYFKCERGYLGPRGPYSSESNFAKLEYLGKNKYRLFYSLTRNRWFSAGDATLNKCFTRIQQGGAFYP